MKNKFFFFSVILAIAIGFQLQPSPSIFDTGEGSYPSVAGTHSGTIMTSFDMEFDTLYTYHCSGTGGHTEYVRIWNDTFETAAHWNGYKENWCEIRFNESFTLVKDKPYNYTIITGSYPQIIHKKEIRVEGGIMTCKEFVNSNGRVYYDWIPSVRLYKK